MAEDILKGLSPFEKAYMVKLVCEHCRYFCNVHRIIDLIKIFIEDDDDLIWT